MRHDKGGVARLFRRQTRSQRADMRDQQRRKLDRIHALRRQRGMRFLAAHAASVFTLTLVRNNGAHRRGFANDATGGLNAARLEITQQTAHADAADLFIIRQRKMKAGVALRRHERGHIRERHGNEALHVGGAAPVQAAVTDLRIKRVRIPRLPIDGHHIGMPRQHQPRLAAWR